MKAAVKTGSGSASESGEEGESDMSDDVDAGVDDEELANLKGNKKMAEKKRKK